MPVTNLFDICSNLYYHLFGVCLLHVCILLITCSYTYLPSYVELGNEVESLLLYIINNTDGASRKAYKIFKDSKSAGNSNPSFNEYLKGLPEIKPREYNKVGKDDYVLLRKGMPNVIYVSRKCLLHGNEISCLWDTTQNCPFLPRDKFPYTQIDMVKKGRSLTCKYLAIDFDDGSTYFGLPSCFFRVNFTSEVNELPIVYLRWIGTIEGAHRGMPKCMLSIYF